MSVLDIKKIKSNKQKVKEVVSFSFVENFDKMAENYHEQNGNINGHRFGKQFFRVDNQVFNPLIEELQENNDCSYLTYANNVIKAGFIPKKISAMTKQLRYEEDIPDESVSEELIVNEVLASKIMNFFGCPTCYNMAIKRKEAYNYEDEFELLSVDFMPFEHTFYTFDEYNCIISCNLEKVIDTISKRIIANYGKENSEESEKLIEDFLLSQMVREHILCDDDCYHTNSGILVNNENLNLNLINFDYEFAFTNSVRQDKLRKEWFKEQLEYAKKKYPKVYKKFCDKTLIFEKELERLITNNEVEYFSDYHKEVVSGIYDSLKEINMEICKCNLKTN